jgi:aspartyl protease family protein
MDGGSNSSSTPAPPISRCAKATRRGFGIRPTPRDYTIRVSTANGEGRAARAELRTVEIGDIRVRDLVAFVHPDAALSVNLLGMSFLARVRWTYDRGKLVLEQ